MDNGDSPESASRLLLQAIGQAVIVTDLQGTVSYWNAAAEQLYGWSEDEVLGRPILTLTARPTDQALMETVISELFAGRSWSGEFLALRRDGSTFPALVVDSGIWADGQLTGIIGVSSDLSEIKSAQHAQQTSELLLRTVVQNSPVAMVAFDAAGTVVLAEGQSLDLLRLDRSQLIGITLIGLTIHAPSVAEAVTSCLAGEPMDVLQQLNGRHFDFRCRPERDVDGHVVGVLGVGTDITVRVEAGKLTAQREARWHSLVSRSADAAIIGDLRTTDITYVSPAITRLFGWQPAQLLGQPGLDLVHPDDHDLVATVIEALVADDNQHPTVEFRLKCADGSYRWVEQTISNLANVPGVEGLVGNIRDITDRREAEDALRRRNRMTIALAASASDMALVLDADGCLRYVNPSAAAALAWNEGETLDLMALHWVHVDDRAMVRSALTTVSEPGAMARRTYRLLGADGEWHWVDGTVTNCLDDPDIHGLIVNLREVTERVEAETALLSSESRYRLIAETAQEGIWVTDPDGRTSYANQKMAELLGRPLEDIYELGFGLADSSNRSGLERHIQDRVTTGSGQYEITYTHPDGSPRIFCVSASPLTEHGVHLGSLAMVADVTDARKAEAELRYRATYDQLTGLPNRTAVLEQLQGLLDRGAESPAMSIVVLVADIDQFKLINDSFGHEVGDELLVEVARRWQQAVRPDGTVARLGGDEFVILCELAGENEAGRVADQLLQALWEPMELAGRSVAVSASIGITVDAADDAETVLGYADAAMYQAKARGRGRAAQFNDSLMEQARNRLDLFNDLKHALEHEQLVLHYQPIVELMTGRLLGFEALCRWTHPVRGVVPPEQFIAAAEGTGLITTLDRWVLSRSCRDAAGMRVAGLLPTGTRVAVNVSASHLSESGFEAAVRAALDGAGLPAQFLELEVTESAVMTDPDAAQTVLESLHRLGVAVAIDDFGTGYSSLAYLRRFPVAKLKVDRSFVEHLCDRADDRAIVTAVIDLASALNVGTVAEGIETFADLALLQRLGCQAGQGYLWSPPRPVAELCRLLAALPGGRFPIAACDAERARAHADVESDAGPDAVPRARRPGGKPAAPPSERLTR